MDPKLNDIENFALPCPPQLVLQLQDVLRDPTAHEVEDILRDQPGISSKLLWISNSPSYSTGSEVTTLNEAMHRIGVNSFIMLALGLALKASWSGTYHAGLPEDVFWKHSVSTAVACRGISRFLGKSNDETAFMCGLTSRIGQLVLSSAIRDSYDVVRASSKHVLATAEEEHAILGITHHRVSRALLEKWRMPSAICDAAGCWGDVAQVVLAPELVQRLASIVRLADGMRDLLFSEDKAVHLEQMHDFASCSFGLTPRDVKRIFLACQEGLHERLSVFMGAVDTQIDCRSIFASADAQLSKDDFLPRTEQTQADEKPRELTRTDVLTGLPNRNDLDHELEALDQCSTPRPYSILMLSIDQLETHGDKHGRETSDKIVKLVARKILSGVRLTDFAARHGEDEFTVILPFADRSRAAKVADRLIAFVQFIRIDVGTNTAVYPTVSCGVASSHDFREGTSCYEVLNCAKAALENAQVHGPNTMVSYSCHQPTIFMTRTLGSEDTSDSGNLG